MTNPYKTIGEAINAIATITSDLDTAVQNTKDFIPQHVRSNETKSDFSRCWIDLRRAIDQDDSKKINDTMKAMAELIEKRL